MFKRVRLSVKDANNLQNRYIFDSRMCSLSWFLKVFAIHKYEHYGNTWSVLFWFFVEFIEYRCFTFNLKENICHHM